MIATPTIAPVYKADSSSVNAVDWLIAAIAIKHRPRYAIQYAVCNNVIADLFISRLKISFYLRNSETYLRIGINALQKPRSYANWVLFLFLALCQTMLMLMGQLANRLKFSLRIGLKAQSSIKVI